jgi:hypothetical protein
MDFNSANCGAINGKVIHSLLPYDVHESISDNSSKYFTLFSKYLLNDEF